MKSYPGYEWFLTPMWLRRFGPLKFVSASLMDRVGLHFFTLYSALSGVMGGVFTLAAFVLTKTFDATTMQVGFFTQMSVIVLLLGIVGAELVEGRDKRPFILWLGLLSRGAFLLFLFCYSAWSFMLISGIFFLFNALVMPAVFSMWQSNVSSEARNRLWGLAVTITTIVSMGSAYLAGKLLDWDHTSFRWVFAGAGVLAMLAIVILTISPLRGLYKLNKPPEPLSLKRLFVQPVRGFFALLATDRKYAGFEGAFMLYGLALMVLFPVIPIYMDEVAGMGYAQAGIASGILGQVCVIFLAPVWGRLMDRTGAMFLCMTVMAILVLFPSILLLGLFASQSVPLAEFIGALLTVAPRSASHLLVALWSHGPIAAVYVGYFIFGIAMSGINVAWSLAPVAFAGNKDASGYSGAHVTLTGVRGMIGPLAGALVLKYMGFTPVLVISAMLFACASFCMFLLRRHYGPLQVAVAEINGHQE
ncbi:MFS transporter [bacterium]|nr:MFS transporter [bacterium]